MTLAQSVVRIPTPGSALQAKASVLLERRSDQAVSSVSNRWRLRAESFAQLGKAGDPIG